MYLALSASAQSPKLRWGARTRIRTLFIPSFLEFACLFAMLEFFQIPVFLAGSAFSFCPARYRLHRPGLDDYRLAVLKTDLFLPPHAGEKLPVQLIVHKVDFIASVVRKWRIMSGMFLPCFLASTFQPACTSSTA